MIHNLLANAIRRLPPGLVDNLPATMRRHEEHTEYNQEHPNNEVIKNIINDVWRRYSNRRSGSK